MPIRRFAFIVLAVLLAFSASAQKRRSVRSPGVAAPPTGQCHTFGFVRAGLEATYVTTTPGGDVHFVITYISDNATGAHTTQKVTTPQGTADVETFIESRVVGLLRSLDHIDLTTTMTVPILGKLTTDVEIDFVPGLVAGPAAGWCVDETWNVPPVTETITTRSLQGTTVNTVTTIASTGKVLAVGETVVTPAGSFQTVKYRGAIVSDSSVQAAITWVSMEHNIVVKQDTVDAAGNVTSVTTLTALK